MINCNQIIQLIVVHGNAIQLAVMLNMQIHFMKHVNIETVHVMDATVVMGYDI